MQGSLNIANLVRKMAHNFPDAVAVIVQNGAHLSSCPKSPPNFPSPNCRIPSMLLPVAFLIRDFNLECALLLWSSQALNSSSCFSLFTIGATVVVVDPGLGLKGIGSCLKEVKPDAFIGIPLAQMVRVLFGWGKTSIRKTITVGNAIFGNRWSDVLRKGSVLNTPLVCNAVDPAAILFTSGSTGVSKGVVYEHEQFHAQVQLLKSLYQIAPGEIDLPTFPLLGFFSSIGYDCGYSRNGLHQAC